MCWSGSCVKASSCRTVRDCSACDPTQSVCVRTELLTGNAFRCVDVAPPCAASPTCECAAPSACVAPYNTCSVTGTQLNCTCPTC
jgi:hypothetical protein